MIVKVVKQFIDKKTGILHNINEEIEIAKERATEINSASLGIFVEEKVTKKRVK